MATNYYETLISQLKQLVTAGDLVTARQLIETELALPYVPRIYEKQLEQIYKQIQPALNQNKSVFTREELITIFQDLHQEHSSDFLLEMTQAMAQYNWHDATRDLQHIFNQRHLNKSVKAMIYNVLATQGINYDFKIETMVLNPQQTKSLFETPFALTNFWALENNKQLHEPGLVDVAQKALMFYLLNQFPQAMVFSPADLSADWIAIARVMLGQVRSRVLNDHQAQIYQIIKSNSL